jgi:putative restriction endonuclease
LITIGDDYTVLVSQAFVEADSEYAIKNYTGKSILLPAESNYYPSVQNLQWHREHVFKGKALY